MDWSAVASITVALGIVFFIRRWAAGRSHLRAGTVLFVIGLPAFIAILELAATDLVQADALIWPLIILPISVLVLSLMLLVRGVVGLLRNAATRRRLTREGLQ